MKWEFALPSVRRSWQSALIPTVQQALNRAIEERLRKIGVHAERVLTEIARVAFSDLRNVYKENGALKQPFEWDSDLAPAIAGMEVFQEFFGRGENRTLIGYTKKLRTFDKVRALEILAKHLKLFPNGNQKINVEVHVREVEPASLPNPELSPKIVCLLKLAAKRKKDAHQAVLEEKG